MGITCQGCEKTEERVGLKRLDSLILNQGHFSSVALLKEPLALLAAAAPDSLSSLGSSRNKEVRLIPKGHISTNLRGSIDPPFEMINKE